MKFQFLSLLALIALPTLTFAQKDCSAFFNFEKGSSWEFTNYNKKGALTSVTAQEVGIVEEVDGVVEAQVKQTITDDKGKVLTDGSYIIKCKDGTLFFNVEDILSPEMRQGLGSLEMSFSGESLELPSRLEVGQQLPDARTEIKAGSGGVTIMTVRADITDRKVEAKEKITVPAGTFECYKVTYNMTVKTILAKTFSVAVWYGSKAGMVKSETYDKKGNLEGRTELSKIKF
jgi:hypothetical protein